VTASASRASWGRRSWTRCTREWFTRGRPMEAPRGGGGALGVAASRSGAEHGGGDVAWCCSQVVGRFIRRPWKGAVLLERHQERPQGFLYGRRLGRREGLRVSICASQLECGRRASWPCRDFDLPGHGIEHTCRDLCLFSIFVLVVSKGWKPVLAPPFQRSTVNLNHCARLVFLSHAIDETDSPSY